MGRILAANRNWDVRFNADKSPEIYLNGVWSPICGHDFWNNDNGATAFCEKLGFTSGTSSGPIGVYSQDAVEVGICHRGDNLNECDSGGARGKLSDRCKARERVKLAITCSNNTSKCFLRDPYDIPDDTVD